MACRYTCLKGTWPVGVGVCIRACVSREEQHHGVQVHLLEGHLACGGVTGVY